MKIKRTANFSIVLNSSYDNKSLQTTDFISWAIFQKYEKGDYEYYEIIKNKIVEEIMDNKNPLDREPFTDQRHSDPLILFFPPNLLLSELHKRVWYVGRAFLRRFWR